MTVGWRSTNSPIVFAKTIMTATAATTAATMTAMCSAIPTAVMIESSEKTTSMTMICAITLAKVAPTLADFAPSSPSSFSWISCTAL